MAKKTVRVSDMSGEEIPDGKGAVVRITFADARRGSRELDVTEGTVKTHVATIFDVLNVHNRVSAVAEARRLSEKDDDSRPAGGR